MFRVNYAAGGLSVIKTHYFVTRLCLYLVTFAILSTQMACAALPTPIPPYLVLITPILPNTNGQCTGVVVSPREIVTAAHCVETGRRVVTVTGQEAWVVDSRVSDDHDVAVLVLDRVVFVTAFAEFGHPVLGKPALLWGFCPYQVSIVARRAYYNGLVDIEVSDDRVLTYGEWIMPTLPGGSNKVCGGDSGGVAIQRGQVVGVISAVDSEYYFVALGSTAYTVPVGYVETLMAQGVANE